MSRFTFHLIPHTHWDREWYLPRAAYQVRLIPVLDDVLDQLEADAKARFVLDGQTILLEDYLAVRPDQRPRITRQVRRGALEIGPWYVLSDLLIPSAASLRRNLAEGARDAARFGRRLDVLYSPDAFGHPAELPRLAAEFGLRRAVVRRGLGRPGGRDRDLYRWATPDGASLLVYHLPAGGYDTAIALADAGDQLARRWAPIRRELVARAGCGEIAVFLGADHHAMLRDVAGLRARLQALEPGNSVRVSGLREFFDAVEAAEPSAPVLRGELRRGDAHAWVLQDVHSTRSRLKRLHGDVELGLSRIAEPLAGARREDLLHLAWRTLLASQFHDTLAGSTCDVAQREQEERLASVATVTEELLQPALRELAGTPPGSHLIVWNPAERARAGILTAELTFFRRDVLVGQMSGWRPRVGPGYRPFELVTSIGARVPVQVLGVRRGTERIDAIRAYPDQDEVDRVWIAFRAPEVPGRAACVLAPREARLAPPSAGMKTSAGTLSNRTIALRVSPQGVLTLTDRRNGQEYPGLAALLDEPDRGDCYTFSRGPGRVLRGGRPLGQKTLAAGPLLAAIETRWTLGAVDDAITARQVVALYADSPLIRLRLELENSARDHRLRARFPVGVAGPSLAGTAFGTEARKAAAPGRRAAPLERAVSTAPAHRYVAAAAGSRGLVLLAPACFEYEWTRAGELAITLIRAVGELSRSDLPERPGHAAWPLATPLAQELGSHRIELALVPLGDAAAAIPENLERLWEAAMLPLQTRFIRDPAEAPR